VGDIISRLGFWLRLPGPPPLDEFFDPIFVGN